MIIRLNLIKDKHYRIILKPESDYERAILRLMLDNTLIPTISGRINEPNAPHYQKVDNEQILISLDPMPVKEQDEE